MAAEKIAADLGYAVGVPVAPVLLRRPHPAQSAPRFTAVSLLALEGGAPWGFGGHQHSAVFDDALEALRVFWGWIGDLEHENNEDNLLWEIYGDGTGALASIDHYRAFGSHGNFSTSQRIDFANGYSCCKRNPAATREIIGRIASITDDQLKDIVGSADELLTGSERDYMLDFLRTRRQSIAELGGER